MKKSIEKNSQEEINTNIDLTSSILKDKISKELNKVSNLKESQYINTNSEGDNSFVNVNVNVKIMDISRN